MAQKISAKITPELIYVVEQFYGHTPAEIKDLYTQNAVAIAKIPIPTKEQQMELDLKFTCVECKQGKKASAEGGMSNLLNHIAVSHKERYNSVVAQFYKDQRQYSINWEPLVPPDVTNVFQWIEFIVDNDLLLNVVEKESNRKCMKMEPIGVESLQQHMEVLGAYITKELSKALPQRFGVIFDGWPADGTSDHYFAVFATYEDSEGHVQQPLLACSTMEMPEDPEKRPDLTAKSHKTFIEDTLSLYDRQTSCLDFICGDNCSVNKCLADIVGVPLSGCAAHRLNLGAQKMYTPIETDGSDVEGEELKKLMSKVDVAMHVLRNSKNALYIRQQGVTLKPLKRNGTRWASIYQRLGR